MLKEAISYVFGQAEEAAKAKQSVKVLKEFSQNPGKVSFELNGQIGSLDVYRKPVGDEILRLDDIPTLLERYPEGSFNHSVWISSQQVVVHLGGFDHARLTLHKTPIWLTLESLNDHSNGRMEQSTVIRLLRRELRGAVGADLALAAIRNLKFRKSSQAANRMDHGSESLGSEIEAEVVGLTKPIPEELRIVCPVFRESGRQAAEVLLDLEVLVHEQKFVIKPMPGAIEIGEWNALSEIRDQIVDLGVKCPIFFGHPTIGGEAV